MTKPEPDMPWTSGQSLYFVIAREMVSPYKNPDLVHQTKKKETNFLGLFHLCLGGDTALGVGNLDTESLGLLDNLNTLAGRDGVADPIVIWLVD